MKHSTFNIQHSTLIRHLSSVICVIVLIFIGSCKGKPPVPKSGEKAVKAAALPEAVSGPKVEEEIYIYDRKGKRDPFVSLIAEQVKPDVIIDESVPPLERYDVSAIKILGIVWNKEGYYAEVILPNGKAYTVKEGITVGVHKGTIQKINKTTIVIREKIKDYKGVIKPKETTLKLREEEE
ncbi:MAG: pilus assembly protein PilP [Nitrospirae bacterium]|nr:pilus assembly protein PilP [Nitrospirota bacterium]